MGAGLDHWDSRDTAIRMAKEIRGRAHGRTPTAGREPSGIGSLTRLGAWESRTTELFGLADRTGGRGRLVPGRVIDSRSHERGGATTLTAWDSERSLRLLDERERGSRRTRATCAGSDGSRTATALGGDTRGRRPTPSSGRLPSSGSRRASTKRRPRSAVLRTVVGRRRTRGLEECRHCTVLATALLPTDRSALRQSTRPARGSDPPTVAEVPPRGPRSF